MELARIWLRNCSDRHEPCQKLSLPSVLPLRVIDLSTFEYPFLAAGRGRALPYVTLSYKWGNAKRFLTTTSTISKLQNRIPLDQLPRTFTDAMKVAHELGFHYLWIDALCIQHNHPKELAEQIGQMGQIYARSALTIFAAAGEHSDAGLAATRDPSLIKPPGVHLSATADNWTHQGEYYIYTCGQGKRKHSRDLPLFQRGWVLQEEILSARGLIFEKDDMA